MRAGNLEGCATIPLPEAVVKTLHSETLRCNPHHLSELMADHTQLDWRPLLPHIGVPCLNCIGCKSGIFPLQGCEAVNQLIPRAPLPLTNVHISVSHFCIPEQIRCTVQLSMKSILSLGRHYFGLRFKVCDGSNHWYPY